MIDKILQNCGDFLIIDNKSTEKIKHRYLYEGHFEGYTKTILFIIGSAKYGLISNPEKRDEYGFLCDENIINKNIYFIWKNMERRCYYKNNSAYNSYGFKGIKVSSEFKTYSIFKEWYINECNGDYNLDLDKDCKSYVLGKEKIYSKDTCMLLPPEINTFISTMGKGIYITPSNTYCVRLRRKYRKINKNFKYIEDAIRYKKEQDFEYINILLEKYNVSDENCKLLRKYVKIFEYDKLL